MEEEEEGRERNTVFNKDFDTNLLNKIANTDSSSVNNNDQNDVNLDPRNYSKTNNFDSNNKSDVSSTPAVEQEEYQDPAPALREIAGTPPENPVSNLPKASANNPGTKLPTPKKSPQKKSPQKNSPQKHSPHTTENGMDNDYNHNNSMVQTEVKEQNTNQTNTYSESDLQALVETARQEERLQWKSEKRDLELVSDQKSSEIAGLKTECQTLVEMSHAPVAPVADNNLDVKMIAALNNEFAEKLIESRKKSEEMLTKHIKKLSTDNSEILKELDVMHSAMSDLHKRYDRAREVINQMKKREDSLEEKIREYADDLKNSENNCRYISKTCDEQLEAANARIEQIKLDSEKERVMMEASIKRLELDSKSWHAKFLDKESSEKELIAICDSLMGVKEQEMQAESEQQQSAS